MRLNVTYEKLRKMRQKKRWSGHELQAESRRLFGSDGVSSTHIYALENGRKQATLPVLHVLAHILECDINDLHEVEVSE